jgi:hypothetical protein
LTEFPDQQCNRSVRYFLWVLGELAEKAGIVVRVEAALVGPSGSGSIMEFCGDAQRADAVTGSQRITDLL